ncbi:MAG: radical SAM protein, partial [Pseudomonadota bacterium]|nr:radical SAM protein [Pseudomonadota bacterium]
MNTAPQIISWNLTRVCNLACAHCYLDAVQRRREASDELTLAEAEDVVTQIAATAPGAMLVLTGGEPLLRRDLETIVAAAARQGLMPVIGTNGTLLDAARAGALRAAGAMGVGISLDSVEPDFHDRLRGQIGAWEGAMRGIEAARAAGLAVLIQTTL